MKKIIILTFVAGTIAQVQASNAFGPSPAYDSMPSATQAQLAMVQPIISTIMANKPVALTLPADLVGVMQQIAVLAQESQTWEPYQLAYQQIQMGWSGPEIQKAMAGNTDFATLFNTYIALNQTIDQYDRQSAQMTHDMQSQADIAKVSAYITTNVLNNRLKSNQTLTQLQRMFNDTYPGFAKFQKKQSQLNEMIAPWVEAFTQLASPQKRTQVTKAVQTAVTTTSTSPKVTSAAKASSK